MTTNTDNQPTPEQARQYIATFREHTILGADYAHFPSGRIHFDSMTDEQAVKVALALMDIEAEASSRSTENSTRRRVIE